jgi:tRNA (adenine57-N1/adenine58-N1)-methyltransferase
MALTQSGDIVQLIGQDRKKQTFIFKLTPGEKLHTHYGMIEHNAMLGQELGVEITSHKGHRFYLLAPNTDDLIRDIKRQSQIIYPKDIGFILMKLAIHPGVKVVECGTGSGGLTTVLAQMVGLQGGVVSYDMREDHQSLARKNLERVGLADRVTFKLRDAAAGFDETDADAFFLDVANPWDYTAQVRAVLKGGGFFGSIVPTANQVSRLLEALQRSRFDFLEVCEVLIRYYKVVPERLRPTDRMVAHTGYLIFGRAVTWTPAPANSEEAEGELQSANDDFI